MNPSIFAAAMITVSSLVSFAPIAHAGIIVNDETPTRASLDWPPGPYVVSSGASVQGDGIIVNQGDGVIVHD